MTSWSQEELFRYDDDKDYVKIIVDQDPEGIWHTEVTYLWSNQVEPLIQDLLHHATTTGELLNQKVVIERADGGSVTWMRHADA